MRALSRSQKRDIVAANADTVISKELLKLEYPEGYCQSELEADARESRREGDANGQSEVFLLVNDPYCSYSLTCLSVAGRKWPTEMQYNSETDTPGLFPTLFRRLIYTAVTHSQTNREAVYCGKIAPVCVMRAENCVVAFSNHLQAKLCPTMRTSIDIHGLLSL
ncbi:hypothetical protein PoB_006439100 [Plakobranchus ocellatus]|uniref:Uncharacterized protein n=1 Tax=Plakobranchus ocellatus TaxID=259542 RepID=A0AAV4D102_9GAST|nr:hypothetical protein PoB_006439100 [Plakobranchus ocellatus]